MTILDRFGIEGQVAIVTGAGRGLGAATAVALAEAGADVVISARTPEQLDGVAAQIRAAGRKAVVVPADLSDLDAVAGLAQTAYDELGRVDTVVNNVGGTFPRAFLDTSPRFLTEAFSRGEDIHDQTAAKVFGTDSGLGKHELRRRAKIINYALLYGKTAFTLAKDIGVTPQVAQEFIDAYFAGFPRVRAFIDRTLEDARISGVVKTMYGRRRLVPELTSRNGQIRSAAERVAVNLPIQGTAADIMKRAMIEVHGALASHPDARMILTVHDELLFEVPEDRADALAAIVRDRMQSAATLKVPLTVDIGIGKNWKEAKS